MSEYRVPLWNDSKMFLEIHQMSHLQCYQRTKQKRTLQKTNYQSKQ